MRTQGNAGRGGGHHSAVPTPRTPVSPRPPGADHGRRARASTSPFPPLDPAQGRKLLVPSEQYAASQGMAGQRRKKPAVSVSGSTSAASQARPAILRADGGLDLRRVGQAKPIDEAKALALLGEGKLTRPQIARELGISADRLREFARAHGIKVRQGSARPSPRTTYASPELIKDYLAGTNPGALARKYGIDRKTVIKQLARAGHDHREPIPRPHRGWRRRKASSPAPPTTPLSQPHLRQENPS